MPDCKHEWEFANKSKMRCRCKLCGIIGKFFRDYEIQRDAEGKPTKLLWRGDFVLVDRKGEN